MKLVLFLNHEREAISFTKDEIKEIVFAIEDRLDAIKDDLDDPLFRLEKALLENIRSKFNTKEVLA
jgi:hypothetical protein